VHGPDGTALDVSETNPMPGLLFAKTVDYAPGYHPQAYETLAIGVDPEGSVATRGPVLTDEGGYRAGFFGTSIAVTATATATFTNGSDIVTIATGSFADEDLHIGDYVKLDADPMGACAQISELRPDEIILTAPYGGTSATGVFSFSKLHISAGAGQSLTVANARAIMALGGTAGETVEMSREVDYAPVCKQVALRVSQRLSTQVVYIGLCDQHATPRWFAWFEISGTNELTIAAVSGYTGLAGPPSSAEQEVTTIALKTSTAVDHKYRVECLGDRARFYLDDIKVAEHQRAIPGPNDVLTSVIRATNLSTAATDDTVVVVQYDMTTNFNRLATVPGSDSDSVTREQFTELTGALQSLRIAIQSMVKSTPLPDTSGRARVNVETGAVTASIAAAQTLATVTTVGTVTTMANQTNVGGIAAVEQVPALMNLRYGILRDKISYTP
jgi:hypothetical protein